MEAFVQGGARGDGAVVSQGADSIGCYNIKLGQNFFISFFTSGRSYRSSMDDESPPPPGEIESLEAV